MPGSEPTVRLEGGASGSHPRLIGRYEILAPLGQGAMGLVYKARDPQLGRIVAIKTVRRDLGLPPEQYRELTQRFYQEATAAGRLNHPNLVAVHDVVEVDGVPYMVMEYVEGRSLADLIAAEGRLPPERAVELVRQVCEALEYAHAKQVVHRDIKPGNILVDGNGHVKLSDFGIARVSGSQVTRTGALLGTPAYMSPEQLGGRAVDGRSDLFSLAVVLYEAVTGLNPFKTDDLVAVLARILTTDAPPARERNPAVSPALEAVLARGLAKQPEARYPSAAALAEALRLAVDASRAPVATPATVRTGPSRGRRRLRAALMALTFLVVIGAGGAVGWQWWWARQVGSIVVTTDPSVEVFVDGELKGRTGAAPLVLPEVRAGEHTVTLRLGSREWQSGGTVRRDEPLALAYRFPEERPVTARGRAPAGRGHEGPAALREALDKGREAVHNLESAWDRLWKP